MTLAKFSVDDVGGKATGWLSVFNDYMKNLTIDSKETGVGPLVPYQSQKLFLHQLAKGMDEGVHSFTCLKARQLGISTIMLPIDLFLMSMYKATQGAIVVDEEGNRENFRKILDRTILSLPRSLRVEVKRHNREALELSNGSTLRYLVAGTRKKGAMGVGGGYSFVHATECSRYGDPEAWASFQAALAEQNPNRLFVYESTARGFNMFYDMWNDAKSEPDQRAIFIGWWAKEIYRLKRGSKIYNHNFDGVLTEEETGKIATVKERYGMEIDDEQLAWYRYTTKRLNTEGGYVAQEHPWTEDDAFMMSGRMFFPNKNLTLAMHRAAASPSSPGIPWKGYRYHLGQQFDETKIEQITDFRRQKLVTLKIFEEPDPFGVYALGADPAYGSSVEGNEWKDRFAIQVLRCYSDRVVQVAEFADDDLAPHQFAWILAHLAGAYRNSRVCLEINGPGVPVILELTHLKEKMQNRTPEQKAAQPDLEKIFDNWAWYFYRRVDSLGGSMMLHFKSDSEKKQQLMLRMKDAFMLDTLEIGSVELLEEMKIIIYKDGWVGAEGRGKDDRTLAFALAYRAYDEMLRKVLIAEGRTFEVEEKAWVLRQEKANRTPAMLEVVVSNFFKTQQELRAMSPEGTVDE